MKNRFHRKARPAFGGRFQRPVYIVKAQEASGVWYTIGHYTDFLIAQEVAADCVQKLGYKDVQIIDK